MSAWGHLARLPPFERPEKVVYQALPLARVPGDLDSEETAVCRTNAPLALPSGLRFIETPSVPAREEEYVKLLFTTDEASRRRTVSPLLARLKLPVEAATAFASPPGMADALANTTTALPGARVVPAAKVWRT